MNTIGEKIAELRKAKSMTQEDLASTIGVSAQSISKWETGTTMPDIMLLPVIADIFAITIDGLYGRASERRKYDFPGLYDCMSNEFIESLQTGFFDSHGRIDGRTLQDMIKECKKYLAENPSAQSGAYCGKGGAIYYSEPTGGVLLKRTNDPWASLLADENVIKIFNHLCDSDFRIILRHVAENDHATFSFASTAKLVSCDPEKTESILKNIAELGLIQMESIDAGEEKVNIYRTLPGAIKEIMLPLYIALTYIKRFAEFKCVFYSWRG